MNEISNTENCGLQDIRKNASDTEPEPLVSTQEQVNEQIKTYIALISKQLELIQWIKKGSSIEFTLNGKYECSIDNSRYLVRQQILVFWFGKTTFLFRFLWTTQNSKTRI